MYIAVHTPTQDVPMLASLKWACRGIRALVRERGVSLRVLDCHVFFLLKKRTNVPVHVGLHESDGDAQEITSSIIHTDLSLISTHSCEAYTIVLVSVFSNVKPEIRPETPCSIVKIAERLRLIQGPSPVLLMSMFLHKQCCVGYIPFRKKARKKQKQRDQSGTFTF